MSTTTTNSAAAAEATVPLIATLIARFTDPGFDGLSPEFISAWQAAPAIASELVTGGDAHPVDAYVIAAADKKIASDEGLSRALAELPDDFRFQLGIEYLNPAFHLGMALGIYLATNGGTR